MCASKTVHEYGRTRSHRAVHEVEEGPHERNDGVVRVIHVPVPEADVEAKVGQRWPAWPVAVPDHLATCAVLVKVGHIVRAVDNVGDLVRI